MTRKTTFFEGWSWFKFNNLGLTLSMALKFYTAVAKGLKVKVRTVWGPIPTFVEVTGEKLVEGLFAPPIRNSVIFNSLTSPEHSLLGQISYPTSHCAALSDLWNPIPCRLSASASHPTLPREVKDSPKGSKYPKNVPLSTFLTYMQLV